MNFDIPIKKEAWDQQKDETNLWFDRFFRFMLSGSGRSIDSIYREVTEERWSRLVADGREKPGKIGKRAGRQWYQKARQFDWWGRAEAWDARQRLLAVRAVSDTINKARFAAMEALEFQRNMMRGKVIVESKDGEMTIYLGADDYHHMRLASNSILNRAGVVHDGPIGDEEDGEVEVMGIAVHLKSKE